MNDFEAYAALSKAMLSVNVRIAKLSGPTSKLPDIHLLQNLGHLAICRLALSGRSETFGDCQIDSEFLPDP